ncbi:MAG: 2-oxoacid:acceptor oxidoreductase family protein [Candidatus Gastranaerophilaceae bacterium]
MEKSILIAGFGGQGILLAGEVLATALMLDDKNVTWYPCYGAEMRGGTVNCEIVASDMEVSSVNKKEADFIIALNQLSFDKFLPKLKKGGAIIANSSLVKEIKSRIDVDYFFAPITALANELGEIRISNIISLGILAKISKLTSVETLHKALDMVLPEHRKNLLPLNLKALEIGFNLKLAPVVC